MTVIELKEKLIAKINDIDNEELLGHISDVIEFEENIADVYEITGEELEAVKEGLKQLDEGHYISHKEAIERANKWFAK